MGVQEGGGAGGGGGLAGGAEAGVGGAADACVRVVQADGARVGGGHVDFEEDGAGEDVGDGEEEVGEFGGAGFVGVADAEEGAGGGGGGEEGAGGGQGGPDFADEAAAGRDVDGVGYDVDAVREVGDGAVGVAAEGGVDGGCVVCLAVAWMVLEECDCRC